MPSTAVSASFSSPLWVFAYGSLMWNPGFPFSEQARARIEGWHRSFCIYSHVYRGTPDNPGLVLGLDKGGECEGVAFYIAPADEDSVMAYLRARELVSNVYHELQAHAILEDGRSIHAVIYAADTGHAQYAGERDLTEQLALIRQASGQAGENRDYVFNTWNHMQAMGIEDPRFRQLVEQLKG